MRFCLLYIFICVLIGHGYSQREVIIKRTINSYCPNPTYNLNKCDYALLVPASRPGRQEVLEYKYLVKPDHVVKTDEKEYYLKWKNLGFGSGGRINPGVEAKIRLFRYDLNTARKKPILDKTDLDTLPYLKDEENFRCNSKTMMKTAATFTGNSREEITKSIFDFVIGALDYKIYFYQDRGAKKALKDGSGDCTEYSELMVTLCRAKKIPARIVMGLIPSATGSIGYHNWVEVFFPAYGWVAFDPTWADHPNSTTTFYSMKNTYVQLSNKRFIKTLSCSCNMNDFPFIYSLKDSCEDLSNGIQDKFYKMRAFYTLNKLEEAQKLVDTLLIIEPDNSSYCLHKGMIHARKEEYEKAFSFLQQAIDHSRSNSEKYNSLYALGNYYALKKENRLAISTLKESVSLGFDNYDHLAKDQDLKNIKEEPEFIALLKAVKEKKELKEKNK